MIDHGELNLLGVNICAVDYEAAVEKIVNAAQIRKPLGVSALAVHGVMTGVMDDEHRPVSYTHLTLPTILRV